MSNVHHLPRLATRARIRQEAQRPLRRDDLVALGFVILVVLVQIAALVFLTLFACGAVTF